MKLRIQCILTSLLSICLMTCSASAMDFPDVDNDFQYATAIEYVSELGIMVGDTGGNFNPDKIVSRAEMATIVCRVLNQAENLATSTVFSDVPMNHWANAYIGKASESGIVVGYGTGKFGPCDPVTFEQAVTMIVRAIGEGDKANSYGGYPNGFLKAARERNLLLGIQAVRGQGLSRGAVAMLLYNYYITQNNSGTSSDGHTHNYIEKTVPGSGGHYEQVQVGTEKVIVGYESRVRTVCPGCGFETYDTDEFREHTMNVHDACQVCYTEKTPIYEEQPKYENRWVEDSPTTIRVCSICGQQEPEAHTHIYIEKTMPGTYGHYEQVQVGTKKVLVGSEHRQYSKCLKCGAIAYTNEEMYGHYDPESPLFSKDCWDSHNMIYDEYVPIYEEQPKYENRWVEDSPTKVRVCEICGQQEP